MRSLLVVALVIAACVPGPGRMHQEPYAQYAGGVRPPQNPRFDPRTGAHNPNVTGPKASREPVFIIPWRQSKAVTEQEREAERQRYVTWYRTQLMSDPQRYVEHHIFPQALRQEFKTIGIDVDLFTILVRPATHDHAHSGQELYGAGGLWNWEWRQWFEHERERAHQFGAWKQAFEMLDRYGFSPHGPMCPYRCGREVMHDLFDVPNPSAPPRGKK